MIKSSIIRITPEIAEEYLQHNTSNFRSISKPKVNQYAREMKNGMWQLNGEAIQFDEDGVLLNGQHRLKAIIDANVSIDMMVVTGIQRGTTTYDRGMGRTVQQIFKSRGRTASPQEIGAVTIIYRGFNPGRIGQDELYDFYMNNNPELFDKVSLLVARGDEKPIMRNSSCLAAVYSALIMNICGENDAEKFCRIANSGIPNELISSYAPLQLRKTFQRGFKNTYGVTQQTPNYTRRSYFETTYKAIFDFMRGKKVNQVYKPDGNGDEILDKVRLISNIQR